MAQERFLSTAVSPLVFGATHDFRDGRRQLPMVVVSFSPRWQFTMWIPDEPQTPEPQYTWPQRDLMNYRMLVVDLTNIFQQGHYRRYKNHVHQQLKCIVGGQVRGMQVWKSVGTIGDVIDRFVPPSSLMHKALVTQHFQKSHITQFRDLKKCKCAFAFPNGVLDAALMTFYAYDEYIPDALTACNYIDSPLDYEHYCSIPWHDIPTPVFDLLLESQEIKGTVKEWFYKLCGHVLRSRKHWDGLEKYICLMGNCSGIVDILASFFHPHDVGRLSNDMRSIWPLLHNHNCLIVASDIQSSPTLNVELEANITHRASLPVIFVGNTRLESLRNRFVVFEFPNPQEEVDIAPERAALLFKCLRAHRTFTNHHDFFTKFTVDLVGSEAWDYFTRTSEMLCGRAKRKSSSE